MGEYRVTKQDINGCLVLDMFTIFDNCVPLSTGELYVPNAFTVNGDGLKIYFW